MFILFVVYIGRFHVVVWRLFHFGTIVKVVGVGVGMGVGGGAVKRGRMCVRGRGCVGVRGGGVGVRVVG